jgi:hypothetical protein
MCQNASKWAHIFQKISSVYSRIPILGEAREGWMRAGKHAGGVEVRGMERKGGKDNYGLESPRPDDLAWFLDIEIGIFKH